MTREEIITECIAARDAGAEVSPACARAIAWEFSGGSENVLGKFARGAVVSMDSLSAAVSHACAERHDASDDERLMLDALSSWATNWDWVVCVDGSFLMVYSDAALALASACMIRAEQDADGVDMPVSVMPFRRGEV